MGGVGNGLGRRAAGQRGGVGDGGGGKRRARLGGGAAKRAAKTGVAGLFAKAAEAKAKAEAKTEAEVKAEAEAKAEAVETAAETAPVASRVGGGGGGAGGTSAIGSSRSRVVTPVGNGDEDGDATRGNAASGRKRDAGCSASGAPSAKRAESSTIARMFAKHTS